MRNVYRANHLYHPILKYRYAIVALIVLLNACQSPYMVKSSEQRLADFTNKAANQALSVPPYSTQKSPQSQKDWYLSFEDERLNQLIQDSLQANLDIRQAWAALNQARLGAQISESASHPELALQGNLGLNRSNASNASSSWQDSNTLSATLDWEIDLWNRIRNAQQANQRRYRANQAELHATHLLVSTQIARTYYNMLRQISLIRLIKEQITTNKQFLELTQLRKSTGQVSILDLQQQEQQLLRTKAQLPEAERNLKDQMQNLAVLLGQSPINYEPPFLRVLEKQKIELPLPPNLDALPKPAELIFRSPSLYASFLALEAQDHDLAVAATNRLPRLSLSASQSFQSSDQTQPKNLRLSNLGVNLIQPIFDAGSLKNQYLQSEQALQETSARFEASYLSTLAQVEQAINDENYLIDLLANTLERLNLAKKNVSEAKFQYANGLTNYLNVLQSLETLQQLELQVLNVRRNLLDAHINIVLAIGGPIQSPNPDSQPSP